MNKIELPIDYIQTIDVRPRDYIKVRRMYKGLGIKKWVIYGLYGPVWLWNRNTNKWISSGNYIEDYSDFQFDELEQAIEVAKVVPGVIQLTIDN